MKSALSFALSALLYDQTNHIGRKHLCLHAVVVKLHNRRNTAKARWGLHRSKQRANANRNAQRGWKPRFLSKRGQPAQSPIYYLCRPRGNNWENKKLQRKPTKKLHCVNKPTHRMWLCVQGGEKRWRSLGNKILPWGKRFGRVLKALLQELGKDQRRIEKRCSYKNGARWLGRLQHCNQLPHLRKAHSGWIHFGLHICFLHVNTGKYSQQAHTQKMAFQRHIYRALISTQTTRQSG